MDVLKRLSEVYGTKVDASRSHGVLRITSDRDTASDVVKLLKYILDNIRQAELDFPGGQNAPKNAAGSSNTLNKPLLEQIEQLTSTVIRMPSTLPTEVDQTKVVTILGEGSFELIVS